MTHVFKDCEQGFHGEYCDKECGKCRDGAVCDSLNGVCPNGCEDNWILPNCTGDIWCSLMQTLHLIYININAIFSVCC